MSAPLRSSSISLYKSFVKCSRKIPRGVARERFVRNIYDLFMLNHQLALPEQRTKLLEKYVLILICSLFVPHVLLG